MSRAESPAFPWSAANRWKTRLHFTNTSENWSWRKRKEHNHTANLCCPAVLSGATFLKCNSQMYCHQCQQVHTLRSKRLTKNCGLPKAVSLIAEKPSSELPPRGTRTCCIPLEKQSQSSTAEVFQETLRRYGEYTEPLKFRSTKTTTVYICGFIIF